MPKLQSSRMSNFDRQRYRVERSLLWEITGSLTAAGNDLRVGKELLFSKLKIVVK